MYISTKDDRSTVYEINDDNSFHWINNIATKTYKEIAESSRNAPKSHIVMPVKGKDQWKVNTSERN